jgi:hypothetical protein
MNQVKHRVGHSTRKIENTSSSLYLHLHWRIYCMGSKSTEDPAAASWRQNGQRPTTWFDLHFIFGSLCSIPIALSHAPLLLLPSLLYTEISYSVSGLRRPDIPLDGNGKVDPIRVDEKYQIYLQKRSSRLTERSSYFGRVRNRYHNMYSLKKCGLG